MNPSMMARALLSAGLLVAGLALGACNHGDLNAAPSPGSNEQAPTPVEGPLGCSTNRDCVYDTIAPIESEADCACPICPADANVINRSMHQARQRAFRKSCTEWAQSNACAPSPCSSPPKALCVDGECRLAGGSR